ncbi:hypothetical protein [uncultured Tateyamaria sp.]|uniref:hypothetical protein n=1 Tax=uncultured Tateyamaria sp. TaxID=455651 RepID=UPI0026398637|nr:hypothetical protein [uncultured Tateyamaria sp.]
MTRSVLWVSLRQLKAHELNTTLRLFPNEDRTWLQKSKTFTKIQNDAIKSFGKMLGQITLGYLVASSLKSGTNITLEISDFSVATPAVYFLSLISFVLLMASISFNHMITAIKAKTDLSGQELLHGFSINAFDVLVHEQESGLGVPEQNSRFLKPLVPIPQMLSLLLFFGVCCLLVPLIAIGAYVGIELTNILSIPNPPWYEKTAACLGLVMTISSGLNLLFFQLPIPMQKHKMGIRWNFLYSLSPHPSDDEKFKRWLDKP